MSGKFMMPRGWMDDFPREKFTKAQAYVWVVEDAAFVPHVRWFNGRQIKLARGELVTSVRHMAGVFGWSEKAVRLFQAWAQSGGKWTQRPAWNGAQSPTIISVCNYDISQSFTSHEGTVKSGRKGTVRAQSGHGEGTQDNKGNSGNEGNHLEETFPERALGEVSYARTRAREGRS